MSFSEAGAAAVMMCLASTEVKVAVTTHSSIWVSVEAAVGADVDVGENAEGADSRKVESKRGWSWTKRF